MMPKEESPTGVNEESASHDTSDLSSPHPISDSGLHELREQIKKAMIPLLIKIFELKFAAMQAKTPSSRLHSAKEVSLDHIRLQLLQMQKDLKLLHLWCESSQKQIEKAIKETEDPIETPSEINSTFLSSDNKDRPSLSDIATRSPPTQMPDALKPSSSNWLKKLIGA